MATKPRIPLREAVDAFEREYIASALRDCDGSEREASAALDVPYRTFQRKIVEHGLTALASELRTRAGISGPRAA